LSKLMDKVLGGGARFKKITGKKMPAWAQREAGKDKKKSEL